MDMLPCRLPSCPQTFTLREAREEHERSHPALCANPRCRLPADACLSRISDCCTQCSHRRPPLLALETLEGGDLSEAVDSPHTKYGAGISQGCNELASCPADYHNVDCPKFPEAVERGRRFAEEQAGKPYTWGGVSEGCCRLHEPGGCEPEAPCCEQCPCLEDVSLTVRYGGRAVGQLLPSGVMQLRISRETARQLGLSVEGMALSLDVDRPAEEEPQPEPLAHYVVSSSGSVQQRRCTRTAGCTYPPHAGPCSTEEGNVPRLGSELGTERHMAEDYVTAGTARLPRCNIHRCGHAERRCLLQMGHQPPCQFSPLGLSPEQEREATDAALAREARARFRLSEEPRT